MDETMDAPWYRCGTSPNDWMVLLPGPGNIIGYIFEYPNNSEEMRWAVTSTLTSFPDWCATWEQVRDAADLLLVRAALGEL